MEFPFERLAGCIISIVTENGIHIRLRVNPPSRQKEEESCQAPALYCQVLTISQGGDFQPGSMTTLTVVDREMIDPATLMKLNNVPLDVAMTSISSGCLCVLDSQKGIKGVFVISSLSVD